MKRERKTIKGFREFMQQRNQDQCLDDQIKLQKTDSEVKAEIQAIMNGVPIKKLIGLEKLQRQEILQKNQEKRRGNTTSNSACNGN
jgi:hypothetical protein